MTKWDDWHTSVVLSDNGQSLERLIISGKTIQSCRIFQSAHDCETVRNQCIDSLLKKMDGDHHRPMGMFWTKF